LELKVSAAGSRKLALEKGRKIVRFYLQFMNFIWRVT